MAKGAFILVAALGMTAFAAVGGFTLGTSNYPEVEGYPPYQEASQDRPESDRAELAQQSKAVRNKQPCRDPESREESQLCADWIAANAARRAALWTKWQVIIGVVTGLGLALTIFLTFRAVRVSEISVEVARDTARRQLRAYVTVEPGGINEAVDGKVRVPLIIENVGETPAHKLMAFSAFGLDPNPVNFNPDDLEGNNRFLTGESNDATLGRGTRRYLYTYAREEFFEGYMEAVAQKEIAVLHWGHVIYEDVFGETHRTHFAFYHWGEELNPESSLRCRYGNTAD